MSISPWSGARELQKLISLKYYDVTKWKIRFPLRLNHAKNIAYIKTASNEAVHN